MVTLGDRQMAQRLDNLVDVAEWKHFYLQVLVVLSFAMLNCLLASFCDI